jgi:hypothetical protein
VDAALHQQHWQLASMRVGGGQRAGARDDQGLHRPAFGRGAELDAAHLFRIRGLERRAQCDHFIVAAGFHEVRAFGHGGQSVAAGGRGVRDAKYEGDGKAQGTDHGRLITTGKRRSCPGSRCAGQ